MANFEGVQVIRDIDLHVTFADGMINFMKISCFLKNILRN